MLTALLYTNSFMNCSDKISSKILRCLSRMVCRRANNDAKGNLGVDYGMEIDLHVKCILVTYRILHWSELM